MSDRDAMSGFPLKNPAVVAAIAGIMAENKRAGVKPAPGNSARCSKCRRKFRATDERNSCHCNDKKVVTDNGQ